MKLEEILVSEVVDLTSLKTFFATDRIMLIEIIEVFLSDTTTKISILEKNIFKPNYQDVKDICIYLKSSFGLMGINCMNEITELELLSENDESDIISKEKLNHVVLTTKESLTEYKTILDKLKSL